MKKQIFCTKLNKHITIVYYKQEDNTNYGKKIGVVTSYFNVIDYILDDETGKEIDFTDLNFDYTYYYQFI